MRKVPLTAGVAALAVSLAMTGVFLGRTAEAGDGSQVQHVLQTILDSNWFQEIILEGRRPRRLVVLRNEVIGDPPSLECHGLAVWFLSKQEVEGRGISTYLVFTRIRTEPRSAVVEFEWPPKGVSVRVVLRQNRRGWRVVAHQALEESGGEAPDGSASGG